MSLFRSIPHLSSSGKLAVVVLAFLLLAFLTGCQNSTPAVESKEPGDAPVSSVDEPAPQSDPSDSSPEEDPIEAPAESAPEEPQTPETIQASWPSSPHAVTFVVSADGKNSTCARCHSPANFVPTMDDMPPSCSSCKFEVKDPPPYIEESAWSSIQCNVCHEVKKNKVQPEVKWLEIAQIEQYAEVASSTELCLKCHAPANIADHWAITLEGSHAGMGCSDCHDPHDATASCTASGCHEDTLNASEPIAGHDEAHKSVACTACHDAGGLDVGPGSENGIWSTFISIKDGSEQKAITSHNLTIEAPCERCHFAGNPWELSEDAAVSP